MSAPENANDRFERLADEFYRETGLMAPGKDSPAEMGGSEDDYRERWDRWRQWNNGRYFAELRNTASRNELRARPTGDSD